MACRREGSKREPGPRAGGRWGVNALAVVRQVEGKQAARGHATAERSAVRGQWGRDDAGRRARVIGRTGD